MELVVVEDRGKHEQLHTSIRLPTAVRICCPMLLFGEVDCKHKLSQQKGIEMHSKLH